MQNNAPRPLLSFFAERLEQYIYYKQTELGYKATMEKRAYAPSFDSFCQRFFPEKEALDKELVMAWISDAHGAEAISNRTSFMRQFARYLNFEGEEAYIAPPKITPIRHRRPTPHLYTAKETRAFFAAADSLPVLPNSPVRHLVAPACFRLMLCCGLRPNEARELCVDNFDWQNNIIRIIDSKDRRDRNVPMAADVAEMTRACHVEIEKVFPGRKVFFPNAKGDRFWSWSSMNKAFWKCWKIAGITEFAGPSPRPYDFRHTFATNVIRRWKIAGIDVHGNLRILQEYMGHACLESTMYYVHLVRGGIGDPTLISTWEPTNRLEEGENHG